MKNLPDLSSYFTPEIVATFAEVHQPRSNFQLERFVVGQHDTPEMQYVQCVTEIQALYYTIKEVSLKVKKTELEIERLRSTGDEIDEIDAQVKELGLEQTRVVAVGAFRELETLLSILQSFPKFTRQEIESGQNVYWEKRLVKQAELEKIGGSASMASHINSLIQIGAATYEPTKIDGEPREIL